MPHFQAKDKKHTAQQLQNYRCQTSSLENKNFLPLPDLTLYLVSVWLGRKEGIQIRDILSEILAQVMVEEVTGVN